MDKDIKRITELVGSHTETIQEIEAEFEKVIVGQKAVYRYLMTGVLTGSHILVEGMPGLAKTLAINTLATILDLHFNRIQFTPDMLPADIRGTLVYNQGTGKFDIKKGPVFTNFLLADEINRAPAKVQSALLEAMQEKTITLGDTTFLLEEPFFVMATQNPIEQEGTYVLPEAQMDRFLLKVFAHYPTRAEERRIVSRMGGLHAPEAKQVVSKQLVLSLQETVNQIYADEKIIEYIVDLVYATRDPESVDIRSEYIRSGASPRASLAFLKAAKAQAFLDARAYVIPEDIKSVAREVLRHRVLISFEAESEGLSSDDLINKILNRVEIP